MLTRYCKINKIDFVGTSSLQKNISQLRSKLSLSERRKTEDNLIESLTLEDVTAFEYWAIIYEQSWELTYSAGRILDVFYSKHFIEILNDGKQLQLYLKKSALFENLGIIGVCNNYLNKFTNLQNSGIERLNRLQTNDSSISGQILKATSICKKPAGPPTDAKKTNDANADFSIQDVKEKIAATSKISDPEKMEDALTEILSKISYSQIGEAVNAIENIHFKVSYWKKYSFLERDFGFFIYGDFDTITALQAFIADYNKFDEYNFYKNMLSKAEINYFNSDATLDYDKVFDALRYNVVTAFVGGGGGRQDNEVYAIIKLLELSHKTTLGYPKKLCNSNGIYGCDSRDRADYWVQFIKDRNLLKKQHDMIASFHYE